MKHGMRRLTTAARLLVMVASLAGASPAHAAQPRYRVVDLGTLDGEATRGVAITNRGDVLGSNFTKAFLWSRASGMIPIAAEGMIGAFAVSDTGQVVGAVRTGLGRYRGFSWTGRGGLVEIGPLAGADECTQAFGVNAKGEVVGITCNAESYRAFIWTARDGIRDLGTLGGAWSSAAAVNQRGQVVGYALVDDVFYAYHAFSWTAPGGMVDLGALGTWSMATAVSENGYVVGQSVPGEDPYAPAHAFLWTKQAGMIDLGPGEATAVNNSGCVIGGDGPRAFFWSPASGRIELGTFGGPSSWAAALNGRCMVVGSAEVAEYSPTHAYVWSLETGMLELGGLEGSTYSYASDINERGEIVGASTGADGALHAVVWQPLDVRD